MSTRIGLLTLAIVAAGCGDELPQRMSACAPSTQRECTCGNGRLSTQRCTSDGSGYESCDCAVCSASRPCSTGQVCVILNETREFICANTCSRGADCASAAPCCGPIDGEATNACVPRPSSPALAAMCRP